MNSILSRVLTGVIGLIAGGVLNGVTVYLLLNSMKRGSVNGMTSITFLILGIILGVCIGAVVGVMQFKILKSLALGAGITFLIFSLFLSLVGIGDMSDAEERKALFYVFSIVLLDGCFVSLFVGLACNALMKLFFQQNLGTDSSLE
jgi:MFS family permease